MVGGSSSLGGSGGVGGVGCGASSQTQLPPQWQPPWQAALTAAANGTLSGLQQPQGCLTPISEAAVAAAGGANGAPRTGLRRGLPSMLRRVAQGAHFGCTMPPAGQRHHNGRSPQPQLSPPACHLLSHFGIQARTASQTRWRARPCRWTHLRSTREGRRAPGLVSPAKETWCQPWVFEDTTLCVCARAAWN